MYKLIRTKKQFKKQLKKLKHTKVLFCDTETCLDENRTKGGLYGRVRLFQVYQIGMRKALLIDCYFLPLADVLKALKGFVHVYHNASYDLHTINCYTDELWLPHDVHDTFYLSKLALYKEGSRFGFYECLSYAGEADENIRTMDKKANQKADWSGVLTEEMLRYAAYDVLYMSLLWRRVKSQINTKSYKLDIANLKYAIEYSRRGVAVDLVRRADKFHEAVTDYEDVLSQLPVNPNSPKQVCEWLGTTKSDIDTLETMKLQGDLRAAAVRKARLLSKTVMFLKKYDRPIIKGFFNPCGAISGRFTCSGGDSYGHMNLQQLPKKLLPILRAREGNVLVYNDYTGLELYMAVAWIGEPTMEKLIRKGIDIHTHTASKVYGIKPKHITDFQRLVGKICNFLLIYGGSVMVLQSTIRSWGGVLMPIEEVREISKKWFQAYPLFKEWHLMHRKAMSMYGAIDVETALGRTVRALKLNDALNIPIQGSSSEVTKTAMLLLLNRHPDEYLINTIHDALILDVPKSEGELWVKRLDECMVDAWYQVTKKLRIPDLPMPKGAEINKYWEF